MADRQRRLHWDIPDLRDQPFETVRTGRDELDRRVLRLLADLLPGNSVSAS
ncbi:hypothetical protein OG320_15020 [Microbispora sp. NBC_01189]|uniref:hypothetical protein n=1 Tax=Microbispora sp. NBC_01189 TaxID=2903583 RepID=UPI002E11C092|nr:hypothetical protein OG320_15020 [Microbispora sp. NBC_01189]